MECFRCAAPAQFGCAHCQQVVFCSLTCGAELTRQGHAKACEALQTLKRDCPGYTDVLNLSRLGELKLADHGQKWLSKQTRGCVAYSVYAPNQAPSIQNRDSVVLWTDPMEKQVYHVFILPQQALEGGPEFPRAWQVFCGNPVIYQYWRPVLHGTMTPETMRMSFGVVPVRSAAVRETLKVVDMVH